MEVITCKVRVAVKAQKAPGAAAADALRFMTQRIVLLQSLQPERAEMSSYVFKTLRNAKGLIVPAFFNLF